MSRLIQGKSVDLVVFDAYGTVFDVHAAIMRHSDVLGALARPVSELWRAKQLEYTWIRTLSNQYRSFWQLTDESLDVALATLAPEHRGLKHRILAAYRDLDAYPDAADALQLLQAKGFKTAILSNGDEDMIQRAVASSGLADGFDTLISVERLKRYKTVPAAYALIEQETGIMADRTAFISSNRWDIAGAAAFGLHTIWLNRFDRVDEYVDLAPSAIIRGLDQLLAD